MFNRKIQANPELRFDPVNCDWVVIAEGRNKRPEDFVLEKKAVAENGDRDCPFCQIEKTIKPILVFSHNQKMALDEKTAQVPADWTTIVIPNKFPAFWPAKKIVAQTEASFYRRISAVGFHEVVVMKNHELSLAQLSLSEIKELVDVYQERFWALSKEKLINYISVFHNHGQSAGASLNHPHSQIIATSLVDSDLQKPFFNAAKFFQERKTCLFCLMNQKESKLKKRIVLANKDFLAVCPFAPKSNFEVVISPKQHSPYFEAITEEEKNSLAEIFKIVMTKIHHGLANPDYNFYLHTAPCDGGDYPFYHWHWTIRPKTSVAAGFEIGTRMEIITIAPEKAAAYLRKVKV